MTLLRRSVDARRQRAARRARPGPLADFLAVPGPDRAAPVHDLPLLAVAIETTGLDPATDRVLSVAWVPLDGDRVVLAGAGHLLVGDGGEVGRSATVHGITDDAVAAMVGTLYFSETLLAALAAPGLGAAAENYVALGDSYSSGVGTNSYTLSSSCKRSTYAYPALWSAAHPGTALSFVACSGATTTTVLNGTSTLPPQINSLAAATTLATMVANLTLGRKKYAASQAAIPIVLIRVTPLFSHCAR